MYTHQEERNVEAICYDFDHVGEVSATIRNNFDKYYDEFVKSKAGNAVTAEDIKKIAGNLGVKEKTSIKPMLIKIKHKQGDGAGV